MTTKKCPACGGQLKLIKLKAGTWYGHSYSLSYAMSLAKPMCDYTQGIKRIREGGKGNDYQNPSN